MTDSKLTNNDIKFIASKLTFKPSKIIKILIVIIVCLIFSIIYYCYTICNHYENRLLIIENTLKINANKNKETFKNLTNEIRYLQSRSDKQNPGKNLLDTMPVFENTYENKNLEFALSGL